MLQLPQESFFRTWYNRCIAGKNYLSFYNNTMNGPFTPVPWSHNSNIYEVNVRQYTTEGTFQAFSRELPRLKDMGVEILWFMPITPISKEKRLSSLGSYYACADYTSINPEFGNLDDFKSIVKY